MYGPARTTMGMFRVTCLLNVPFQFDTVQMSEMNEY
jgi:hypothetical protein